MGWRGVRWTAACRAAINQVGSSRTATRLSVAVPVAAINGAICYDKWIHRPVEGTRPEVRMNSRYGPGGAMSPLGGACT